MTILNKFFWNLNKFFWNILPEQVFLDCKQVFFEYRTVFFHGSIITKFCTHRVDVTIKNLREAAQRTVSTMRSGAPHGASPSGRIGELLSAVHARALDLELRWDHDSHRSAETCGTPNLAGLSTGLVYGIFSPP